MTEKEKASEKLTKALECIKRGWPVLPLHGIEDDVCTCDKEDCSSPGKHPIISNGLYGASLDEDQIREWWSEHPRANVGIRTGEESGLVVLDIDPRNGGAESLEALESKHGSLPETVQVETGGGGQHYYFKHSGQNVKCRHDFLGKGIDLKADGGYIVAPSSLHASGERYRWAEGKSPEDCELADLPQFILDGKKKKQSTPTDKGKIYEGERNTELTSLAGKLHQQGYEKEVMLSVLCETNNNRCVPPLPDSEVEGIVESVSSYPAGTPGDKESQATALVRLAEQAVLFHSPDDTGYAIIEVDDHRECWPIESLTFQRWLKMQYYNAYGKAVNATAWKDAEGLLLSKAIFDGEQLDVFVRVAGFKSKIYLDLGDEKWRAAIVSKAGWQIVKPKHVIFTRYNTTRALAVPVKGGDLNDLKELLNIQSDDDWLLIAVWLLGALNPNGPYPLLVVTGEQGSSKSTFCRVLRSLIDPQEPELRSQPKEEHNLMISAKRVWILVYDNISKISDNMSDALCRLATGGGFGTRKLYSNDEEQVFNFKRSVILNGISEFANRSDLADRAVRITLPPIPASKRMDEKEFWKKFNEMKPRILGALLDVLCSALRRINKVELDELPRMADFAKLATAAEKPLGFKDGAFMRVYKNKRDSFSHDVVESSAVGSALVKFMGNKDSWSGIAKQLLEQLSSIYYLDSMARRVAWPENPMKLRRDLDRLVPNLRSIGINIDFIGKQGARGDRMIEITKVSEAPPASPVSPVAELVVKRRVKIKRKKMTGGTGGAGGRNR